MSQQKEFKKGECWQSPRGILYKVVDVNDRIATLRMGLNGSMRKQTRYVDATNGWKIYVIPEGER
ncbi:hypothetical protein [Klebsiella oxytoca]|uniref:hypothetical protein n=1 Tax=Klebsiella oxytoca TaxID=571 RepID=UPI001ECC93FC|nr:hypothetical protein [Klebsiella oxytoca]EJG2193376.1 hypothetical protein [Klebsiella oxytoca]MDM4190614.1 hypothetical protein [Klebsiella oxytoca]MDM4224032.1 hypothetical protein [Klebsiella oxytoca]MDM4238137.1 hypothetical protein [Klebsiella oxytoca]MDM4334595.1 hypothetical protein [Klebsiella oxytoca]